MPTRQKIIFPGWGMPLELYTPYSPDSILDFGFFPGGENSCGCNVVDADPAELDDTFLKNIIQDDSCVIIAHSLGTLLALRSAQVSEKVKAVVLIGGFAKFTQSEPDYPDGKNGAGLSMMQNMMKLSPKMVLNKFYQAAVDPSELLIKPSVKPDTSRLKTGLQCLVDTDLREILKDINIPALILHGDSDKIVSAKLAEFLSAGIPNAKLHIIKNAGHALPFTHTSECLELINEFLD